MTASLPSAEELHVRRFERDLSQSLAASFSGEPLEPLLAGPLSQTAVEQAWARRDVKTFAGLCQALQERGALHPDHRLRFAAVLLNQDREQDSLAVLQPSSGQQPQPALQAHLLARALARVGRTGEALEAARRSRQAQVDPGLDGSFHELVDILKRVASPLDRSARWPAYRQTIERQLAKGKRANAAAQLGQFLDERAAWLEEALTAIAAVDAGAPRPHGWREARRLIEQARVLGPPAMAAQWLERTLASGAALAPAEVDEAFALAEALASPLDAREIGRLVRALAPICRGDEEGDALAEAAALLDRGDDSGLDAARGAGLRPAVRAFIAMAAAAADQPRAAIGLLGPLSAGKANARFISELARCTGLESVRAIPLPAQPRAPRRIFDLFPFNGEAHLLDIKLGEMADWVERFVIVESRQTFTGLEKPLYFEAVRERYARYASRIEYVVIDAFPEHVNAAWAREFHQRDRAVAGIADVCAPDDLVLITDVDEVIDRRALDGFEGEFAGLRMQTFRYFLNYRQAVERKAQLGNASVWKAGLLGRVGSSYARVVLRSWMKADCILDAGWHFTSVNDAAGIANKIRSYSHQENAEKKGVAWDEGFFAERLDRIRSGELEPGWERWEIDERLPSYVRRNRDELAALIL
jgi:hypothetical protein